MSVQFRIMLLLYFFFFFFQAEDGIRDHCVTGVQTCALPISYAVFCLRSQEHTSELQSHSDLVCLVLLDIERESVVHLISSAAMCACENDNCYRHVTSVAN